MELYEKLKEIAKLLLSAIKEIGTRGRAYAKAYCNYRKLLRKEILTLKAQGLPATLISDLARGEDAVADAKEEEIITEALYKSCLEAINVNKILYKSTEEQLKREYGASE